MAVSGQPTPQSTASSRTPPLLKAQFLPNEIPLQRRFETILKGSRERWIYAIYWEYSSAASLLGWGDGYYNFKEDNGKTCKATSSGEQDQRKSVIRLVNSFISRRSATPDDDDQDVAVNDVTDTEWFFFLSMVPAFVSGTGLLGQAFSNSSPVWVTGPDRLPESACQRARQLQKFGLQTMVCIPCPNGVVEVASTEVVLPNPDIVIKVLDLFDFNCRVRDPTTHEIKPPWEDKSLHETEKQDDENDNLFKQSRGKEKISDSKCPLFLLSESSDGGSHSTRSYSYDYSGPS